MEVATSESMTLAARRLNLTQSAVSLVVRRLEMALGVPLFDRERRPLSLTMPGKRLRARADTLLREAAELPAAVLDSEVANDIRIGLIDTFASTAGPALIRHLLPQAARVVVWSGLSPTLGAALLDGEVDLIVSSDSLDDTDGLQRFLLWREPFVLLLPRIWPAARRLELDQLAAQWPMIRFSARSHVGAQIERHLRRVGVSVPRRVEVDGSDALAAMVSAGVGWAIATPLCLLQGAAHAPGIRAVPLPGPRLGRSLSLICRNGDLAGFAARTAAIASDALRDGCVPRLRHLSPWLAQQVDLVPILTPFQEIA